MSVDRRRPDALEGFLLGRRVTPKPLPDRPLYAPDDEDSPMDRQEFDQSASTAVQIRYVDAMEQESERRISCRLVTGRGWPESVYAWCFERQALRQFRIDRILELYDLATAFRATAGCSAQCMTKGRHAWRPSCRSIGGIPAISPS